ncbi:N-acetyl-L,L-diaminopimelate deacetylase [Fulvivirga imtechensis AK7]|uniref:N-acetyl-L,L-diaminopimelate deacetylase n=1 Tax=Fulvivirga imtechensis AK7 TaxID=1237149 RepID=L8JLW6_9BACT|nr:amidohydrolase [Fulvivirga imtechensis]ELR69785.1 N-acetyl-L,L-diaminopimelate deacetylase [Fulvivirga imtechensis AK7]
MKYIYSLFLALIALSASGQNGLNEKAEKMAKEIENKVIEWRRYFHEHPELSNREVETAAKIAGHLKSLGLEVQTGVAKTGVVGLLKGGKKGPVVALRADIDALPVTERVSVPFASKVVTEYNGIKTGVMHACGHDTHIAMLMGVAEVLTSMKKDIPGTVKFIFQPAEEGAPPGEEGGADLMIKEGVLENPKPEVIFGLHISAGTPIGQINYKPGGAMAASDRFTIKVKGSQAHGSTPWAGVDPVVTASQIIYGLQTIVSRQTELTKEAAVITVGEIKGGVRFNIIPEEVEMTGTIRTLDTGMQDRIHEKIKLTATKIAESNGATAEVHIQKMVPVTYNDPELTSKMLPSLERSAGKENVNLVNAITGAEDFSYFQKEIPGLYFFVGGQPLDAEKKSMTLGGHHTPDFYIDESGMLTGVKAMLNLTLDYMQMRK